MKVSGGASYLLTSSMQYYIQRDLYIPGILVVFDLATAGNAQ